MAQLAAAAQDIYTKLQAITALASSVGLAVGGQEPDPGMTKQPLPAAWVLVTEATNENTGTLTNRPPKLANVRLSVSVMLYVPYNSQSDLLTNQIPLLESVIQAIQGTEIANQTETQRWNFAGFKLVLLNTDRLGYRITFELYTPLN